MKRMGSMVLLGVLTLLPAGAAAQENLVKVPATTVREFLHQAYAPESVNRSGRPEDLEPWRRAYRLAVGQGVITATALLSLCVSPLAPEEFVGYMEGAVNQDGNFLETVHAWILKQGCRALSPNAEEIARAHQEGRNTLAQELAAIRTETGRDWLRWLVARGQANDADAEAVAYGLVAGARLLELELQTGGQRAPTPSP